MPTSDTRFHRKLGRTLQESRIAHSLTRGELAELAHVSVGAILSAEEGDVARRNVHPKVTKMARALGWPTDEVDRILHDDPLGSRPRVLSLPLVNR